MKSIKVAMIDDGVNMHFATGIKLDEEYEIAANKIERRVPANSSEISHGSICAAIFCKHARNYQLVSIKILDQNRKSSKENLVKALEWCMENDIELINLSIGSSNYNDYADLKHIVEKLCAQGIIIVAASDNRGIKTYPASMPGVIGVNTDRLGLLKETEFVYIENPYDGINILSFSEFTLEYANGEKKRLTASNSYAVPYITALACNFMNEYNSHLESIHWFLQKMSCKRDIFTLEYIKKNALHWQERIEAPIITMLYSDNFRDTCSYVVRQLTENFRNDGYYCIGGADNLSFEDSEYLYNLEEYAKNIPSNISTKIGILYNVEMPDILILAFHEKKLSELIKLHNNSTIDIIICIENKQLHQSMKKFDAPCQKSYLVINRRSNFLKHKLSNEYGMSQMNQLFKDLKHQYK